MAGIGCPEADHWSTSAPKSSVVSDADMMRMDFVRGVSGGVRLNPAEADFPFYPGSDDDSSSSSSGPPPFSEAPWSTLDGNDGSNEENFGVPECDRVYGSEVVHNDVEHDSSYFRETPHTTGDYVEGLIRSLLEEMACPRYAFDTIMDWARYASDNNYDFAAGGSGKKARGRPLFPNSVIAIDLGACVPVC
jgi:hypothetical protein